MRYPGLLLSVLMLLSPGAALAQNQGEWTGTSVGLQFGFLDAETSGVATIEGDGGTVGARAFYDYDFGEYVIGGGFEWDSADVDLGAGAASIEEVFRLSARAGIDAGENWYYGTIGYAHASVDDPGNTIGDSDGYFFGLGYEVFLNPNTTLGAELLHHEFDDFDLQGLDVDATTLNLSVNFRF